MTGSGWCRESGLPGSGLPRSGLPRSGLLYWYVGLWECLVTAKSGAYFSIVAVNYVIS